MAPLHVVNIPTTNGALLIGALVSLFLSGIVTAQVIVYIKLYRKDTRPLKALVYTVWGLDFIHSGLTCASMWEYLVLYFGHPEKVDYAPWSLSLTIVCTALITLLAHSFFTYRIYKLSNLNVWITIPIGLLFVCRLSSALATAITLGSSHSFRLFLLHYPFLPTLGLVLSAGVDIIVTSLLCYYLSKGRTGNARLDGVVDALMLYAFETSALTCAATIAVMICWLTMPHNRIFMGIHFLVAKLYANSILVSLNTRKSIKHDMRRKPIVLPGTLGKHTSVVLSTFDPTRDASTGNSSEIDTIQFRRQTLKSMQSTDISQDERVPANFLPPMTSRRTKALVNPLESVAESEAIPLETNVKYNPTAATHSSTDKV